MKLLSTSALVLVTALTAIVQAWDKDDHEIFRLRDELERFEGPGITFYDFLEVSRSAKQIDIDRAFRKRSRALHPDKARQALIAERAAAAKATPSPGAAKPGPSKPPTEREIKAAEKTASERFTRLGLIAEILKDDRRRSYDHFLDNGFPAWRGTGYYYNRFRPGLFSTLFGLFVFSGGLLHYVVLVLGHKQQKDFVQRYIRQARQAAWGNTGVAANVPGLNDSTLGNGENMEEPSTEAVNRRERRAQDKEAKKKNKNLKPGRANGKSGSGTATPMEEVGSGSSTPVPGARKRIEAENGKILVVDRVGNVFLEEEDEETEETSLLLLDPNALEKPTFKQTFLYRLPAWMVQLARERISGATGKGEQTEISAAPEIHVGNGDVLANAVGVEGTATNARQRKRKGRK